MDGQDGGKATTPDLCTIHIPNIDPRRWLFLIEGLITLLIGLASFFKMPASAVETKKWFRPKGWFNDREVRIVVNRVLRDDPSKGIRPSPM